ncbi:MAG: hypothetical protein KDC95_07390 [Planctomycetes bacterium]|nr:hypothetical protein [Planctomycetota bacterium]
MRSFTKNLLILSTISLLLSSRSGVTQTTTIIGLADDATATTTQIHSQAVDPSSCIPATGVCKTALGAPPSYSGGSAYDARNDAMWISDGKTIQLVDLASCKVLCSFAAQMMNPQATVSGLACSDGGRRLLQLETMPGYAGLRSYDATQCPPVPLRDGCTLSISNYAWCAGLAIDEPRGIVWVSVTLPGVVTSRNFMRAHALASKCTQICEFEIPICGPPLISSDVLGLAYDPCSSRLFATFGLHTLPIKIVDPLTCKYQLESCCEKRLAGKWRGLAVRSTGTIKPYATGCIGKGCPFCSSMTSGSFGGYPSLGNRDFGYAIQGAPTNSLGLLIVGAGRCTKGIGLPFLCGAIYPSLSSPTFFLGPVPLTGVAACDGSARVPLPIPSDAGLCDATICLEWVVVCGAISGFGLSPTHELVIR